MDRKKRQQKIRVLVTEIIMVIAVVALVGILTAVVSGWRLNGDFSVEQYGQLDIRSYPTGASIVIDGENQAFALTNISRMLTEGSHSVKLEREGFTSWEKTVSIVPGWAVRLRYPRLFRMERTEEVVRSLPEVDFVTVAPNRESMLYGKNNEVWKWMSIRGDETKVVDVDLTKFVKSGVVYKKWAWGSERMLLQNGDGDFVVANLQKPTESINLGEFEKVLFANGAGSKVWALKDSILYVIEVGVKDGIKKTIEGVEDFAADENEVVYRSKGKVLLYHEGDEGGVEIMKVEGEKVKLAASSYAGEKFVGVAEDQKLRVFRMDNYPTYGSESDGIKEAVNAEIPFGPRGAIEVSYNGEFFVLRDGEKVVVFDAELSELSEYDYPATETWWADDYTLAATNEGELTIRDFDGTNVRSLATGVADYPAVISANNKWLYFIKDGKIIREQVN